MESKSHLKENKMGTFFLILLFLGTCLGIVVFSNIKEKFEKRLRGEHLVSAIELPEIAKHFKEKNAIDLGDLIHAGKKIPAKIPIENFQGCLFVGTTGAGKTSLASSIIKQIIGGKNNCNCIVVDPHSTLVHDDLIPWCTYLGKKIMLIDLGFYKGLVTPWNFLTPQQGLEPEDIAAFSLECLDAVWNVSKTPRQMQCLLHGFIALSYAELTIAEFPRLFQDAKFREFVVGKVTNSPNTLQFFSYYQTMSESQKLQYASAALNKISLLLSNKSLRCIFTQSRSINLADIINNRDYVLLIALDRKVAPVISDIFAHLILASIKNIIFSRKANDSKNPLTFLFADEQHSYLSPSVAATLLNQGRKYNFRLCCLCQFISQSESSLVNELLENTWFKAIGTLDKEAEYFEKRLFPTSRKAKFKEKKTSFCKKNKHVQISDLPPYSFLIHLKKYNVSGVIKTRKPPALPKNISPPVFEFAQPIDTVKNELNKRSEMIDKLINSQKHSKKTGGVKGDPFSELL